MGGFLAVAYIVADTDVITGITLLEEQLKNLDN
jgi:hypothetical protein